MTEETCPPTYESDPETRYAELRPPLLRTAVSVCGDYHLAEDAVQTAMIRVLKKFPDLAQVSPERLKAYSVAVLRNALNDEYRKSNKRKVKMIPSPPEDLPEGMSTLGIPEDDYQDIKAGIYRFVSSLPPRQKEAVVHCVLNDMHPSQAAKVIGVMESSVRRYLNSALRRLEKEMVASSKEVSA
ncbi:sigma-70 family RNA polymerase sigma factor [Streptomyces sp. CJ_13]|uniref:RNA polymerase sigma factor n=1 Tax=Streptomyces sp. CJ_13 TaxID=2724943 RepID=UPI001BDD777A|nr:sigma-70 family RNA polymerase sigma factor [Streptomyces sp. CJ_13]MBT1187826.1 sigma-70 family RNA polymerase sigma factor [Streptomyces sp. CJ_13]